ncbi:MAG: hypothetical protein JWM64_2669 [Frankiales bacterium]|nr:hypothetical protein [Frankiales bacterium]
MHHARALVVNFRPDEVTWITEQSPSLGHLDGLGQPVRLLPVYDRHPIKGKWLRNVLLSLKYALQLRPKLIVTTGAGVVAPFCLFATLLGARLIIVETSAQVRRASVAGRCLAPFAKVVLVQWPGCAAAHGRKAVLCVPLVLQNINSRLPRVVTGGTFVGVGTMHLPFNRLLRVVEDAAKARILPRPVIVQSGPGDVDLSTVDEVHEFLHPQELERLVGGSDVVICHAGTGIIEVALACGIRPILLPRSREHGEHYDDHQREIVATLASYGYCVELEGPLGPAHIDAATQSLNLTNTTLPQLADALRDSVRKLELEGLMQ